MRIRSLAGWAAAAVLAVPAAALAAPATPDPGFGTNGVVVTGFPGRTAAAVGMILDRAGRPVVVAKTGPMELGHPAARARAARTIRPSPPGCGRSGSPGTRGSESWSSTATGTWPAGGSRPTPGDRRFALVRWDAGGARRTPASSCATGSTPATTRSARWRSTPQQRIVAAGRSGARIGVARYGSNGVRDAAFSARPRLHRA